MKKKQNAFSESSLVNTLLSGKADGKYTGKHVVVIGGKAHILPFEGEGSAKIIERLEKKYPGEIPHLVFVPRGEMFLKSAELVSRNLGPEKSGLDTAEFCDVLCLYTQE